MHFWKRERAFTFKRFQWKYCSIMAKKYLLVWSKLRLGYFMVYCHWCLNNSKQKLTSLLPCFLTAVIGSCQAMCSLPLLCDKIKQWPAHRLRTCLLPFLCWRKNQNYFVIASCLKNILPDNFAVESNNWLVLKDLSTRELHGKLTKVTFSSMWNYISGEGLIKK